MPKQVSARSWLYSWGSNSTSSVDGIEESAQQASDEANENRSAVLDTQGAGNVAETPSVSELVSSHPPETHSKHTDSLPAPKSTSTSPVRKSSPPPVQNRLNHKASAASLVQYSASNWLGWTSKSARSNSLPEEKSSKKRANSDDSDGNTGVRLKFKQDKANDIEEAVEEENGDTKAKEEDLNVTLRPSSGHSEGSNYTVNNPSNSRTNTPDNTQNKGSTAKETSQDNANDTSDAHTRKKSWGFWNSAEESVPKKGALNPARITNTILKSTPSIPSKKDFSDQNTGNVESRPDSSSASENGSQKPDDAVLYEPHHSATEFRKINTHKNENISENMLVPNWQTCLRVQDSASYASTASDLQTSTGSRSGQAFDIKYWKSYFSNISARLGLTASDTPGDAGQHHNDQNGQNGIRSNKNMEEELYHLQERSYRLYGKSLSRLPPHKRACLPNPNHYYTSHYAQAETRSADNGANNDPVSITNDALGNLLINYNRDTSKESSDIVSKKVGPLRKIKRILVIGVHGFFPTKMIRPLIGAPKGTSSKFASEAEKAVIRYLVENDMMSENEENDVSIQKIALEKEGKILDRVEFFLQILTKWQQELNEADFIFIAAHSQGCVVSIILLALLIKKGILKHASEKRIGILGMAGVNNGPFYGIDKSFFMKAYSAIEHDSMMELFELTKFDSPQSIAYKDAMQTIIGMNVKLCLVGSVNDQLVPLYSALASHIFHPNIYRACYIDSSSKTPEFIRQLISFCCQLQNTGYFDNNVIKEISPILAGPLTGGGHSKIYNDGKVYDLGIKFMLDTDDLVIPKEGSSGSDNPDVSVPDTNKIYVKEYNVGKIGTNPFILPWCLRGLIFNVQKNWRTVESQITISRDAILKSGTEEINSLYESFDRWRPETKALKDLKFRLNGIRASKL